VGLYDWYKRTGRQDLYRILAIVIALGVLMFVVMYPGVEKLVDYITG
jgi:hypothetical protein